MIVSQEDQIWLHASYGNKKIFLISEEDVRIRECILNGFFADLFGLLRTLSFDFLHVRITRYHNGEVASLGGFAQDKMMPRMEMVECTEDENFHTRIIASLAALASLEKPNEAKEATS